MADEVDGGEETETAAEQAQSSVFGGGRGHLGSRAVYFARIEDIQAGFMSAALVSPRA
jgi:hypothetical protein